MVIWNEEKNQNLKLDRNISFEEISEIILEKKYLDIRDHPNRSNQSIFIIELNNYIYAVPFIIDEDANIFLKTVYPSRKL